MQIIRIWKGYKEFSSVPYFVGQRQIQGGRLDGCFKPVTNEYNSLAMAEKMLTEWKREQDGICLYITQV